MDNEKRENKKIGLELASINEMEGRSVENWREVSKKWNEFTLELVKILASCDSEQRAGITQEFSEMETRIRAMKRGSGLCFTSHI